MVKIKRFSYENGKEILEKKGLLREIDEILRELEFENATHNSIQSLFKAKGWETEMQIFKEKQWKWDAFKDKVALSIEFSLIDAIQRDLLRALLLEHLGKIDCLVFITLTAVVEPYFENVKSQIHLFAAILTFPIYLIGLDI